MTPTIAVNDLDNYVGCGFDENDKCSGANRKDKTEFDATTHVFVRQNDKRTLQRAGSSRLIVYTKGTPMTANGGRYFGMGRNDFGFEQLKT